MNFNPIRKLVSGNKSRLKDHQIGVELDLCYLTNQIILMGFPASGIETIYRNSRKQVKRWLEARHGLDYTIYNFCPLTENHYDSSFFNHQVHRFPFPDHHPPPLSMIPLFVSDIASFLASSDSNMAVIHCKAGKGRSGTMSISYLMTLAALPDDPNLDPTDSRKALIDTSAAQDASDRTKPISPNDTLLQVVPAPSASPLVELIAENPSIRNQNSLLDFHLPSDESQQDQSNSFDTKNLNLENLSENGQETGSLDKEKTGDSDKTPTGPRQAKRFENMRTNAELMAGRISDLLRYHTGRRMLDPNSTRHGVSIPSQRRWLGYWGEVLLGNDARLFLNSSLPFKPAHVEIKWIKILLNPSEHYFNLLTFKTKIAVQLAHYKSSYIDSIDRATHHLEQENTFPKAQFLDPHDHPPDQDPSSVRESPVEMDIDWEDSSDLVLKFASFGENPSHPPPPSSSSESARNPSFFDGSSSIGTQSSSTSVRPESITNIRTTKPHEGRKADENGYPRSSPSRSMNQAQSLRSEQEQEEEERCSRLLTPVRLYPNSQSASNSKDLKKKVKGSQAIQNLGGVKIDPTREVQCKFVVGSTGSKHASLMTDVVSLGYLWFIPAFHSNDHSPILSDQLNQSTPSSSNTHSSSSASSFNHHHQHQQQEHQHHHHHQGEIITHFDNHQIDFCHLNLLSHVQICWQFTSN
ncbi:Telomerase protein component 1 [Puccinia graminis f. sp. tritici]|uniref:phosphatidylinositol-3,4,5-trisphosphate 3-phosphatase n=1 Tax=Puccinia graminis f. sp. tritici TaxID=56615 RepID=A0A5B0LJD3_PUCGR|nr:Telomerase protein component 1 [Puccinia graminis f. sp. tritici]